MSIKNSARAIADAGSGMILATVEIAASPERVFHALTTPDEIVHWGARTTPTARLALLRTSVSAVAGTPKGAAPMASLLPWTVSF